MRSEMLVLLALVGCAEEPLPANPCEPAARDQVSYEPEDVLCVQLEMNPEDFEALGNQFRFPGDANDQFDGVIAHVVDSCTDPFPDPYSYFPADLVVDGQQALGVGVRKKGFVGSVLDGSQQRPSLKIKLDVYVEDQLLPDDTERLTLNNNLTDTTRMRTCMAYSVFHDAGYPTPRCNLANVMVNGQALGSYTHVEAPKKRFLQRAFGNNDGSLYEVTLTDFTDEYLTDGLGRWEAKTDDSVATTALLQGVADALTVPDDELEQALDQVVDLELFFRFWALETLIAHGDGFNANTNNSYVYFDPDNGDRAVFIPWGPDDSMSSGELGAPTSAGGDEEDDGEAQDPADAYIGSELSRRLSRHPELSQRYPEALQALLDEAWDEERLLERVELFEAHVADNEPPSEGHTEAVGALKEFIEGRRAEVQGLIDGEIEPGGEQPASCGSIVEFLVFDELGEVVGTVGHSCAAQPGRPGSGWAWAAAGLLLLGRRRRGSSSQGG